MLRKECRDTNCRPQSFPSSKDGGAIGSREDSPACTMERRWSWSSMDQSSQSRITQEAPNRPYQPNISNTHHYRPFTAQTSSLSEAFPAHTPIDAVTYPTDNPGSNKNTANHRQTRGIISNKAHSISTSTSRATTQTLSQATNTGRSIETQSCYTGDYQAGRRAGR
jgi:hypothetical protein